jgi:hypothetical protein
MYCLAVLLKIPIIFQLIFLGKNFENSGINFCKKNRVRVERENASNKIYIILYHVNKY